MYLLGIADRYSKRVELNNKNKRICTYVYAHTIWPEILTRSKFDGLASK